jgi:HK97 family phage portal protein
MGTIISYPAAVWPWQRLPRVDPPPPQALTSISDPAVAFLFGATPTLAGVTVNEKTALGVSAFWRGVMLIAGTIAGLPLKSYTDSAEGERERVRTWVDQPGARRLTPFEWKETSILHVLLHGNTYLEHLHNGAGAMIGTWPIHPRSVSPEWETDTKGRSTGRKLFRATLDDGQVKTFTEDTMTQIMGPSVDGLRGLSVLSVARQSLGTAIAGDRAASKLFGQGALFSGLVTPQEDDVDEDDAKKIKAELNEKVGGWEQAGGLVFVNRKLNFAPWTMSAVDAQFLQSRQFEVEEVARWLGVPPHLLMQTEKQTSWGTGVESQNRGLSRFSLAGWTSRFEQRLSWQLPEPRFCEFDYAGLERPTPEQEIQLLIAQVAAGLLTPNEARKIRNLPPIEGGDVLRIAPAPASAAGTPSNRELEAMLA